MFNSFLYPSCNPRIWPCAMIQRHSVLFVRIASKRHATRGSTGQHAAWVGEQSSALSALFCNSGACSSTYDYTQLRPPQNLGQCIRAGEWDYMDQRQHRLLSKQWTRTCQGIRVVLGTINLPSMLGIPERCLLKWIPLIVMCVQCTAQLCLALSLSRSLLSLSHRRSGPSYPTLPWIKNASPGAARREMARSHVLLLPTLLPSYFLCYQGISTFLFFWRTLYSAYAFVTI